MGRSLWQVRLKPLLTILSVNLPVFLMHTSSALRGTRSVRSPHCNPPCTVLPSTNSSAGGVLTKLRVGCLNLRGLKSNSDYLKKILGRLDICGISEHWLHHYDLPLLSKVHSEFYAYSTCSKPEGRWTKVYPQDLCVVMVEFLSSGTRLYSLMSKS